MKVKLPEEIPVRSSARLHGVKLSQSVFDNESVMSESDLAAFIVDKACLEVRPRSPDEAPRRERAGLMLSTPPSLVH